MFLVPQLKLNLIQELLRRANKVLHYVFQLGPLTYTFSKFSPFTMIYFLKI